MIKYIIINNDYHKSITLAQNIKSILQLHNFIEDIINPKYVFVIGGDGTLLKSINKFQNIINEIIFIIIKSGSLCFYSSYNNDAYYDVIQSILNNNCHIKKLPLLEINYNKGNKSYVLNEVKIVDHVKTIRTNIYINNELLEHFRGSGLVFATSTGSTGYMRAIGGAIITTNRYKLWEMKEIAPVVNSTFSTINTSLIFDDSQIITLNGKLINKKIIIDTFEYNIFSKIIKIKISDKTLKVIYDPKHDISIIKRLKTLFSHYNGEKF